MEKNNRHFTEEETGMDNKHDEIFTAFMCEMQISRIVR